MACAQDKQFEAAEALYAIHELAQARSLYESSFDHGWPTDRQHEKVMVEVAGEGADLLTAVYLASRAGLELSASDHQLSRKERAVKAGDDGATVISLLERDLRAFRSLSKFDQSPRGFRPIFLPLRRAKADLKKTWNEDDINTWAWKSGTEKHYTLEGLGFALLAEATYARDQLTQERQEEQQGRTVSFPGRTGRDGFFGFIALQSAAAKLWELRHKLILDMEKRELTKRTTLRGLSPKTFCFPIEWTAKISSGSASYTLTDADYRLKTRLGAQAAVLLGASELVALCDDPKLKHLFKPISVKGKPIQLFPKDLRDAAIEVATFAFQSMSKLHVSVKGSGRASSHADRYDKGPTITPTDLGLFLMGMKAFLTKVKAPAGRGKPTPAAEALKIEHGKARTLTGELSKMIQAWQQNQQGLFYDTYSVRNASRQVKTRSLASQAFAIRGLLAAHVALGAAADSDYLTQARATLERLDGERWDKAKSAYLEENGKATVFGATAVLGALRELALVTNDGRYVTRYRQYLESLHRSDFLREAKASIAPGLLSEVEFK